MASSMDVLVYLGFDSGRRTSIHEYLESDMPEDVGGGSSQRLTLVAGREILDDLPGSGQAGTVRVYVGLIRRGSVSNFIKWLEKAPWQSYSAIMIAEPEDGITTIKNFGGSWPIEADLNTPSKDKWFLY